MCQAIREIREEGIMEGIKALIITCRELGASFEETAGKVRKRFQMEEEEVQKNMTLFWDMEA